MDENTYYLANRYETKQGEILKSVSFNTLQKQTPYTLYLSTSSDINKKSEYIEIKKGLQKDVGQVTVTLSKELNLAPK